MELLDTDDSKIMLEGSEPIRLRSDRFIGSKSNITGKILCANVEDNFAYYNIEHNPALFLTCCELINNATDHVIRSITRKTKPVTYINVEFTKTKIVVVNDGVGIPLKYNKRYSNYTPTIFFTKENSGENINDKEDRYTSGRNGCGSYIANAYSNTFVIDLVTNGTRFCQEFSKYCEKIADPVIEKTTEDDRVAVSADLDTVGLFNSNLDIIAGMLYRKVYEIACIFPWVNITCNDKSYNISLVDYTKKFYGYDSHIVVYDGDYFPKMKLVLFTGAVTYHCGFVNGVSADNGTHIKKLYEELNEIVYQMFNENKTKKTKQKSGNDVFKNCKHSLKKHLSFVMSMYINKPSFNDQVKGTLNTKITEKIIGDDVKDKVVQYIKKKIMPKIGADLGLKQFKDYVAKVTKSINPKYLNIPKYISAQRVGPGSGCILIVTEGDSAQSAVEASINALVPDGNALDLYGIYPLKGKGIKNPRKETKSVSSSENKTFIELIKILGIKMDDTFTSSVNVAQKLNYGHLLIITDADPDGIDIKSQIINVFSYYWPTLLVCGFFWSLRTPCIRIKQNNGKVLKEYYTVEQYKNEISNAPKGNVHYYKGLGTNTKEEFYDIFADYSNKISYICKADTIDAKVEYQSTEEDLTKTIKRFDQAFSTNVTDRKEWVLYFNRNREKYIETIPFDKTLLTFIEHIDKFHILFADYKNRSSIPSIIDGLKPVQRKIIDAMLYHLKSKKDIKVTELSGKISNIECYQHGDVSLNETIVRMAQDFPGSNNLPLLVPIGMFGTRQNGTKFFAKPRYLHTRLQEYTKHIFNADDYPLFDHVIEEDKVVEPKYFVPLIPFVLVNGSKGMGYGVSTNIPPFKPKDIVTYIIDMLKGITPKPLIPYCEGIGYYKEIKQNVYNLMAKWEIKDNGILFVYETPIDMCFNKFKSKVERMIQLAENEQCIKCKGVGVKCICPKAACDMDIININANKYTFKIKLGNKYKNIVKDIEMILNDFGLNKQYSSTNMWGYDENDELVYYENVYDIVNQFLEIRSKYYDKRKAHMIAQYGEMMLIAQNKLMFIDAVRRDKIAVKTKKNIVEAQIEGYKEFKFARVKGTFDYLTDMKIRAITQEGYDKLKDEYDNYSKQLKLLENKTTSDMYLNDLNELLKVIV
jgi:DNA topoisomerase-2